MDDEEPVPGIDEPRTDGQDELRPRTPSLKGLSFVLSLRQLFSPHYCLLYNIFFEFLGIPLINFAVVKKKTNNICRYWQQSGFPSRISDLLSNRFEPSLSLQSSLALLYSNHAHWVALAAKPAFSATLATEHQC